MPRRHESRRTERARTRLRALTSRFLGRQHRHAVGDNASPRARASQALLVVDVQNDFVTGVLPIHAAARILPILNRYTSMFAARDLPVYLARDCHAPGTSHLTDVGQPLPQHCVCGTAGAAAPSDLEVPVGAVVVSRDASSEPEWSAFAAHHPGPVSLRESFEARGVRTVYVAGLGPGVSATVLDGTRLGLEMVLLADAVRGIDGTSARLRRSIDRMCRAGARVEQFEGVARELAAAINAASSRP